MADRKGVQRFCNVMAWLCVAGMISIPLTALAVWAVPTVFSGEIRATVSDGVDATALLTMSPAQRLAALTIIAGGVTLQVAALWLLRRVFVEGSHGRWFSLTSVHNFRRFAWLCVAMVAYTLFHGAAMSVITSWHLEERSLRISFDSENIQFLFGSLIMLFVAHMFAAGREVDEENAAML